MHQPPLILPKAVLFDMDGTLTQDACDFAALRAEIGLGPEASILEDMVDMSAERREAVERILHQWEHRMASESVLNVGCLDLLDWLTARGILTALITRNTRRSVETVLEKHGLKFEVQITREDGIFKPRPEPLWMACERLGVSPGETWMVGDWKYDIEAANAAGIRGVWLSHGRAGRPFDAEPKLVVRDLCELGRLLRRLTV